MSAICDEKLKMLVTATEATVVQAGTLSKPLESIKCTVKYKRNGGLYVTKGKVNAPGASASYSFDRTSVSREACRAPGSRGDRQDQELNEH